MSDLPLLLAGPILRRVEPGVVSVWVAAREACMVRLQVYEGLRRATQLAQARQIAQGETKTIRLGEQLHIAVVTARPQTALLPEQSYAYNLTLSGAFGTRDLAALHLLQDRRIGDDGAVVTDPKKPGKVNLALGYHADFLPSFALPPLQLSELRLLHGSCRRANKNLPDGLAWVDDFIANARTDPKRRPHQLLLSGDQIYADDVARPMLDMLNHASKFLIGGTRDASDELLPIEKLPVAGKSWPADTVHFPVGYRLTLTQNEAKLTSRDGHSHLLSFGEYCAMYLFSWANACWPHKLPPVEHFLPPMPWEGLIPSELKRPHILAPEEDFVQPGDTDAIKRIRKSIASDHEALSHMRRVLPKVRRALANVPTYMMFDEHEVTDDWNLNPIWRDRVFTSPLGRTVLRNGLVSYALFQGWGNDPEAFEQGDRKKLLEHACELFPEGTTQGPDDAAAEKIDTLLGLDGKDPPVKWHYRVPGTRHLLLALDNRTRRSFVSRVGPPGNVAVSAMKDQVPEGPLPPGIEVLIVVVEILEKIGLETLELLKLRAVDPDALDRVEQMGHFLPALFVSLNLAGDTVSTDFRRAVARAEQT